MTGYRERYNYRPLHDSPRSLYICESLCVSRRRPRETLFSGASAKSCFTTLTNSCFDVNSQSTLFRRWLAGRPLILSHTKARMSVIISYIRRHARLADSSLTDEYTQRILQITLTYIIHDIGFFFCSVSIKGASSYIYGVARCGLDDYIESIPLP